MPIDYEHLMSLRNRGERVSYTDRDTMLHALAIGLGRDPGARDELPYVSELAGLKALPTLASVLTPTDLLDDCGWDADRVVLRAESVTLARPLDEAGTLLVDSEVAAVFDKGAEAGALIVLESRARRERDGQPLFTVRRTLLARGDGGFGGPRGSEIAPHRLPDRTPDMTQLFQSRPDQALLFRLSGDRDPQHVDPAAARQAGLAAPSLHSLCVLGIACHAVLRVICEYDHTLITSLAASFTGPMTPGEAVLAELWQDANVVSFRLRIQARDVTVLDHGRCVLAA